ATADNNVIGVAQYNSGLESNIVLFNLNYISGDTLIVDPVEINELKNNSISIFPNPVQNNLFIEADKEFNHVTITNMQGAIIYAADQNNVTQQEIVLNQIPSGIYILRLEFDGYGTTTKFVKQ
ncbi:MAG: T9SS type A sorting domain-containing protein, partial [Chitinophagales bacterium]